MTPGQCRAARALIAISQADLARAAVVPVASVADFETGVLALQPADLEAIRGALERLASSSQRGATRREAEEMIMTPSDDSRLRQDALLSF